MAYPFRNARHMRPTEVARRFQMLGVTAAVGLAVCLALAMGVPTAPAGPAYAFNADGRPARITAADGSTSEFHYGTTGALTEVRHRAGGDTWLSGTPDSVRMSTDEAAGSFTLTNAAGELRHTIDPLGRRIEVRSPAGATTGHHFDPWGQRVRLVSGTHDVHYRYDVLGQLLSAQDEVGTRVEFAYLAEQNRVERRLSSGVTSVFQSTAGDRLESIRHSAPDGRLLCAFRYEYDADERVALAEEATATATRTIRYAYDALGRLLSATPSDGPAITFSYDALGNRTGQQVGADTQTYGYDDAGRLVRAGDVTLRYDAAGRLIAREDGTGRTTTYRWNALQQLVEVRTPEHTIRYAYDGAGHRIRREVDGRSIGYVTDTLAAAPQVLAERDDTGTTDYLFAPGRLGRRDAQGRAVWLLEDRLGSSRCVVDARGTLLARYDYSPFGLPLRAAGDEQTEFLFAGEQWDAEAGLYYLRARYYDPALGRFISEDPLPLAASLARPQGLNRYAYAEGDPVNRVDPLGLQAESPYISTPTFYRPYDYQEHRVAPVSPPNQDWLYSRLIREPVAPQFERFGIPSFHYGIQTYTRLNNPSYMMMPSYTRAPPSITTAGSRFTVDGIPPSVHSWPHYIPNVIVNEAKSGHLMPENKVLKCTVMVCSMLTGTGTVAALATTARGAYIVYKIDEFMGKLDKGDRAGAVATALDFVAGKALGKAIKLAKSSEATVRPWLEKLGESIKAIKNTMKVEKAFAETGIFQALATAYHNRQERQSKDMIDKIAKADPLIAGGLNTIRNIFFPPPPGGGGGAAPAVGGVYLDRIAQVFGDLGHVIGASYDAASGRLIMLGDKPVGTSPMPPEYLAEAIRAVYSDSPEEAGMTIDPLPSDPLGPVMAVRYFGETTNTRIGSVMFEADRIMKSYSVGLDNVSKTPVQSAVSGYRSLADMGLENPGARPQLWSRFWLVPAPVTAGVSEDGKTLVFDPIKMHVRTETMRWDKGKLISAGGVRDPHAEAFATHFIEHYEDFARENPIYSELKRVTEAVAFAKWLRAQDVRVDEAFIRHFAGTPYPTPDRTPSARIVKQRAEADGRITRTLSVTSFGGVEMAPMVKTRTEAGITLLQVAVRQALAAADARGSDSFDVTAADGTAYRAVALPLGSQRAIGSFSVSDGDLADGPSDPLLASLPGLARYYDSTHNDASEFGQGWSLLLPELRARAAGDKGKVEYLTVEGRPDSRVQIRQFTLSNAFGLGEERFTEPFVDQELLRVGFRPASTDSRFRGVYPEGQNAYRLVFRSGEQAVFDTAGRLRVLFSDDARADYEYEPKYGRLTRIRFTRSGREQSIRYERDTSGRITMISAGVQKVVYGYDPSGNLVTVTAGNTRFRYGYEESRRLLTSIERNDRVLARNRYDAYGRLIALEDAEGQRIEQRFERTDEGTVVTQLRGVQRQRVRRVFGADGRLLQPEDTQGTSEPGADAQPVADNGWRIEAVADERAVKATDPSGQETEYRFTPTDQLAAVRIGEHEVIAFAYDGADRLQEVRYPDGRETFDRDAAGRVTLYRQHTADGPSDTLSFGYGRDGALTKLSGATLGRLNIRRSPDEIVISRGRATVRAQFDADDRLIGFEEPDGQRWRYTYMTSGALAALEGQHGEHRAYLRIEEHDGERSVRLRGFTDAADTRLTFDPSGALLTVTDALAARFSYTYDDRHRLNRVARPDGRCTEFIYREDPTLTVLERTTNCSAR